MQRQGVVDKRPENEPSLGWLVGHWVNAIFNPFELNMAAWVLLSNLFPGIEIDENKNVSPQNRILTTPFQYFQLF